MQPSPDNDQIMNNPEDQTSMIIMNNYFGIGIDADVCLQFHNKVLLFSLLTAFVISGLVIYYWD